MNNEFLTIEELEVNPPTYDGEKIESDGSLAIAKPVKKIKTTNTNIEVFESSKDIVK